MIDNVLTIGDMQFKVIGTVLAVHIYQNRPYTDADWDCCWQLEIKTQEVLLDNELVAPRLYFDELKLPMIKTWTDIGRVSISWDEPHDHELDLPNGCMYFVEHCDIPEATLEFSALTGASFMVEWSGVCDLFWKEGYWDKVPFSVRTCLTFEGVSLQGKAGESTAVLAARLAQFMDPTDFVPTTEHSLGPNAIRITFNPKP